MFREFSGFSLQYICVLYVFIIVVLHIYFIMLWTRLSGRGFPQILKINLRLTLVLHKRRLFRMPVGISNNAGTIKYKNLTYFNKSQLLVFFYLLQMNPLLASIQPDVKR